MKRTAIACCAVAFVANLAGQTLEVGRFPQEVRRFMTTADGLPSNDVRSVAIAPDGTVYAATARGLARYSQGKWATVAAPEKPVDHVAARAADVWYVSAGSLYKLGDNNRTPVPARVNSLALGPQAFLATENGLYELTAGKLAPSLEGSIRQVAVAADGRVAAAAASGLYLKRPGTAWQPLYPLAGNRSWAPRDVRGVAFDARGRLWFASAQGVGMDDGAWHLFTGEDGLPHDDFTLIASGGDGAVWFGTKIGAIRYDGVDWEYRQGLRWLPDDAVAGIAVTASGDTWLTTAKGISVIERRPMTLPEKAKFFEDEIDKRHRRTPYEYVLGVALKRPGDTSDWTQHDSDNDGLWTSMYGAGECYAYAVTGSGIAKSRAKRAFEALRFLRVVTQGGDHPAPPGFVARTILPASGPDPNVAHYTAEKDARQRDTRDKLWKVIVPRWPKSADGMWYWKSDTSSDELDGHYFFYARYYDLVADTVEEKARVREHVAAITDHLLAHDYQIVDHDGKVTRWGVFDPAHLNHDEDWWEERGTNSLSILSYLKTAAHITGDAKYEQAARELIARHGYDANVLIQKTNAGPGAGNQSDDEMVFMCLYNLLQYETDPVLKQRWALAFSLRWQNEAPELNPLFNYMYAAQNTGAQFADASGVVDLSPKGNWLAESVDTLRRYPLDRVDWRLTNHHRKDVVPLPEYAGGEGGKRGWRRNGRVLPIDERFVDQWNHDPWDLDQGGAGRELADGSSFLLPYYMGLYHKFIGQRPIAVIAHRGEHLSHTENTLPAFQAAIDAGADYFECDVRTTADGRLVLMHDGTVDRTTNGKGRVSDLTFDQIRALDARGSRVPAFKEALELARGRIGIYVDNKQTRPAALVDAIDRAGMGEQIVIYGGSELQQILTLRPTWKMMPEADHASHLQHMIDALQLKVAAFDKNDFNTATIAVARKAGIDIFVDRLGPQDNQQGWQSAIDAGATGIQTDHPGELVRFLRAHGLHR